MGPGQTSDKSKFLGGALLLGVALISFRTLSGGGDNDSGAVISYLGSPCARDELLVRFRPGVGQGEMRRIISTSRTLELGVIPEIDVHRLKIPAGSSLSAKIEEFERNPTIAYVEPDYCLRLASTIPDDPIFPFQWAFRNTGQPLGPPAFHIPTGTPGADIKAAEAWDKFQGSSTTLVAIVDTGVDLTHPDLMNHIFSPGIDFVNNDFEARDDHGHGTHLAGIIGAETNNGRGVAGLNWNVRILPVKVFNKDAVGLTSWVASGIIWATQNGARVINMSFGGRDVIVNQTLEIAIKYAYDRNVVLVAAAGNDGIEGVWFPAAYEQYVIAAAASDQFDRQVRLESTGGLFGSNSGPEVDVAAPGIDVLSTWAVGLSRRGHPGWDGYVYDWGTSMSTAFVSGLAALIISYRPDLMNQDVMDILRASADDVNADTYLGPDIYLGYGRINASKALQMAVLMDYRRGRGSRQILKVAETHSVSGQTH